MISNNTISECKARVCEICGYDYIATETQEHIFEEDDD